MNAENTTAKVADEIVRWDPSHMIEIYLDEPDDFLKIRETLSRIGVESKRDENVLYQSCHILHKQGKYFIVHFKELFNLDGKENTLSTDDVARTRTIAVLLSDWGLCRLAKNINSQECASLKSIKVVKHSERKLWELRTKYNIGEYKNRKIASFSEAP